MRSTTVAAVAAVALLATSLAGGASSARATASRACAPTWKLVHTPVAPTTAGFIEEGTPSVLSPDSAWLAVAPVPYFYPDVLHWDSGSVINAAPLPHDGLTGVTPTETTDDSFDSNSDGWVLGQDESGTPADFMAHWHGGRWTIVPPAVSPRPATDWLALRRVMSVSPDSAWAVGGSFKAGSHIILGRYPIGALIEHWDGTQWAIVPNPAAARSGAELKGLTVVSPRNVWAVGMQAGNGRGIVPLVEHFDGIRWSTVLAPAGNGYSALYAISAAGGRDIWATGDQTEPKTTDLAAAMIEHWNGKTWRIQLVIATRDSASISS